MKKQLIYIFLLGLTLCSQTIMAQDGDGVLIRGKLLSDTGEELISAAVLEVDKTDRVINHAMTDMDGAFSMQIKSTKNRLKVSYLGFETKVVNIGDQKVFNIRMKESNTLQEVVVKARKTSSSGTMDIPTNEISFAMQKINTKEFEGLSVTSIDDALQGQIAGLDIVGNGNLGGGSSMRIRGTASISGSANPLIVINGIPREDISTKDTDFSAMNEQQLGDLLSVHPDDILEVTVLKDAASTAVWGSRGAGGVIMITLKKGIPGITRVNYTYKMSLKQQPEGLKMLNGDGYSMMMKEAMFNRELKPSSLPEFNYLPELQFSESRYFSGNTDWRKAVTQTGVTHDHYVAISGGGEKASFRVTGGYVKETGTVIQQGLQRFTSNVILDYHISDRILFGSDFMFTYADQDRNWKDDRADHGYNNGRGLLDIAYKKMPNLSIYDKYGDYYQLQPLTMNDALRDRNGFEHFTDEQKWLRNPVALANLATNKLKSHKINPLLRVQYDFYAPQDPRILRFKSYVAFNMNNDNVHKFLPKALASNAWDNEDVNRSDDHRSESISTQVDASLQWKPDLGEDQSLMLFGSFNSEVANSTSEDIISYGFPVALASSAAGYWDKVYSGISQGRMLKMVGSLHYAYKAKYIADFTLTREGNTKFGPGRKYGYFPGVSLRWNVSDEPFMNFSNSWLDMFSLRPSWGISGKAPGDNYLHYSQYKPGGSYAGTGVIVPDNLRLTNLRWEKNTGLNLGADLDFLDYTYHADFNLYHNRNSDLLLNDALISTSTGYEKLKVRNTGEMENNGWEVNLQGNKFVKAGDFSMDFTFNIARSTNKIIRMDADVLDNFNQSISYDRDAKYLGRAAIGYAYGSIYGYKYEGVYQYNIESYNDPKIKALVDAGKATMPVARNQKGDIIYQANGQPLQMMYNQGQDGKNYKFQGGDAIYKDVNHDGNIDELDLVYLGNSNPQFNGGFSLTLRYKQFSLKSFFTYRTGNQVVNAARRSAENMDGGSNQSIAVNWRWRTEGDERPIPRALYKEGYNWLPSDRFVEDASYLRFKYLTLNYVVPAAVLKQYSLRQLTLYATVTNLLVFTKYQGLDPEVGPGDFQSDRAISYDNMTTPRAREVMIGVNIGF
ncbi:SusC/RagA family TonB-linked outer membrane protein [Bacteroidia bacterium]|nr:SusC/RagA family TonB-linked outer membrane protein [Bacteroidia bacterium]